MQVARPVMIAALALAILPPLAFTHHSYTMFDMTKDVTLEGTVKEFQWTNPHIWIQLLVKDASGKEVEWAIEGASPNMLTRAGWTRKTLKPGDKAQMVVHPVRAGDHPHTGSLASAIVNGKPVLRGQAAAAGAAGETK
jgi:hypothetical protein